MQKVDRAQHLPQYVGYAEIEAAFQIDRRTIQRMLRDGEFPKGVTLPGRRGGPVRFLLSDVLAWNDARHEQQQTQLRCLGVSDPDKLKPEPVENTVAREMTRQLGEDVHPDDVIFGAVRRLSKDDSETVAISRWLGLWHALEERFGQLNRAESFGVIYGLFPAMRQFLEEQARSAGREICPPGASPIQIALMVLAGPDGRELLEAKTRGAAKLNPTAKRNG